MSDFMKEKQKVILFIEDQELHYEQVAAQLRLHGYECRRVSRAEAPQLRQLADKLRPVAAVVDFVLLSTSQRVIDDLTKAHMQRRPPPSALPASPVEQDYGVACIPLLREVCPGIKILIYSQYVQPHEMEPQINLYAADAGVPKERDAEGSLTEANAREIAARVREMVEWARATAGSPFV